MSAIKNKILNEKIAIMVLLIIKLKSILSAFLNTKGVFYVADR